MNFEEWFNERREWIDKSYLSSFDKLKNDFELAYNEGFATSKYINELKSKIHNQQMNNVITGIERTGSELVSLLASKDREIKRLNDIISELMARQGIDFDDFYRG